MEEVIRKFRKALENADVKRQYVAFNRFPAGSCSDASILLADYLKVQGYGDFDLVSGENELDYTHAWLENVSFLIDITADQFGVQYGAVVFKKRDVNANVHLGFTVVNRHQSSLKLALSPVFGDLSNAYKMIKEIIAE